MTDRELLELAAKAAGIHVYESDDGSVQRRPILVFTAGGQMGTMPYEEMWNPLNDDAQALWLAVKLEMNIYAGFVKMVAELPSDGDFPAIYASEPKSIDPYAATRRAIVRAAAEIGKGKK